MTDAEIDALEKRLSGPIKSPWRKEMYYEAVILELIAELRQARAERDWLANRLGNLNEESSYSELCPDKFSTETVCKQTIKCNDCWLQAAKEAASCQK